MKASRKVCSILSILLFVGFLTTSLHALEAFEISNFDVNMIVNEDNSYLITETIQFEFKEKRHGIIRILPLKTYRGNKVLISNIKVEEDKFEVKKSADNLEIKIGDPNSYVDLSKKYVITYLYTIGDDRLKDMDEIYFNIIGSEWNSYIDNITFSIKMPKGFETSKLNFTTGKKASTQNDQVSWNIEGNTIKGNMISGLGPYEALTIALPLPRGYFSLAKPVKNDILDIFRWLFSILATAFGIGLWIFMGRRKPNFPVVEFYPPQGLTSADIGYLIDGKVDSFDITSLIIYWANKGYLTITEQMVKKVFKQKKIFIFTKINDPANDALNYEHTMFKKLFYLGDGVQVSTDQLTNRFYTTAEQTKRQIKANFETDPKTRIFSPSNTWCKVLLFVIATFNMLPSAYIVMDELDGSGGINLIFKSIAVSLVEVIIIFHILYSLSNWKVTVKGGRILQAIFILVFEIILLATFLYTYFLINKLFIGAVALLSSIILGWFANLCKRRTELGIWYEEHLIGFKEFLKVTELDRIKLLVEENPQYFYHILPFAMVLGVTDKWVKNFDQIVVKPPDWYHSTSMYGGFYASTFTRELESGMQGISQAFYSRPSNSGGSSSGGSAGGGSGGGGGSSW